MGPVTKTVDAMDRWPGSQEPKNTGFQIANNTEDNFFEWFAKNPDRLGRYGQAMAANAASEYVKYPCFFFDLGAGLFSNVLARCT